MNRPRSNPTRGFTLIELLVVIVIIGILIALLVPVIAGAVRNANEARVSSEIQLLVQALTEFKQRYGDYPPSRILMSENGTYDSSTIGDPTIAVAPGDITVGQLAERSVRYLRKFYPRLTLRTSGAPLYPSPQVPGNFPDFNGNGQQDPPYILEGHECLVFFLGGVPSASGSGMAGLAKTPSNPFINDSTAGTSNRTPPLFEFRAERLVQDDNDNVPGYNDPYGTSVIGTEGNTHFYVYFSAYGQNGYDPNDANSGFESAQKVIYTSRGPVSSVGPNPYTSSVAFPVPIANQPATFASFINANSYQIISSGSDGYYGIGGQFTSDSDGEPLPLVNESDFLQASPQIQEALRESRTRERDNLTSFSRSRLQ